MLGRGYGCGGRLDAPAVGEGRRLHRQPSYGSVENDDTRSSAVEALS
jgi:hypothetical protein